MYHFQNPNDFYLRNQQMINFPPQQHFPQVNCRFITNIDEAKAAMIDPLSINLFLDSGTGKIYLKKISNNGQSEFLSYSVETNNSVNTSETIKIDEIKERLINIESFLGELKNDKSVSNDEQSANVFEQSVASSNATNDRAEPTGLQKNAGNDKWKKR